jgi:hypothetical protein
MLTPGQDHDLACAEPLLENTNPGAIIADKAVRFRRAGEWRGPEALLGHDDAALEAPHRLQDVETQLDFTTIGVVGCDPRLRAAT